MLKTRSLLALFLLLQAGFGWAGTSRSTPPAAELFKWESNAPLTPSEQSALIDLGKKVQSLLPQGLKQKLTASIRVLMTGSKSLKWSDLPAIPCDSNEPASTDYLGRVISVRNPSIELSSRLIPAILAKKIRSQDFRCGHKNYYKLAVATLIHELVHIVDAKAKISSDPEFQRLAGWSLQGLFFKSVKQDNDLQLRSPDAYERTNAYEALAVNVEYFSLDPQYACRRPLLHRYLTEKLGKSAAPSVSCDKQYKVFLPDQKWVTVDPDRVYQVHYLVAGAGTGIQSRFGHSLIRVVGCAPFRKKPSAECLNDIAYHTVFGFAAELLDLNINFWKGLTGKYHSELSSYSFPHILSKYTLEDNRSMTSYPVIMNREEIQNLVEILIDKIWSYQGHYAFTSKNCAVDARNAFAIALQHSAEEVDLRKSTPKSFLKELIKNGKIKLGSEIYYPSWKEEIQTFLRNNDFEQNAAVELLKLPATQRQSHYQVELKNDRSWKKLAAFLKLEMGTANAIPLIQKQHASQKIQACLERPEQCEALMAKKAHDFKKILLSQAEANLWNPEWLTGYGIPLARELTPERMAKWDEIQTRTQNQILALAQDLTDMDSEAKALESELDDVRKNIQYLMNRFIEDLSNADSEDVKSTMGLLSSLIQDAS